MEIKNARFIKSEVSLDKLPKDNLIEIALAGRSNVGKSSFINSISNNNKLARTSKTPGKTVTLNYYLINNSFYIVDLPGYGFASRSNKENVSFNVSTDEYITKREELKAVIMFVDAFVVTEDDIMMANYLKNKNKEFYVVLNKIDKLKRNDIIKRKRETLSKLDLDEDKLFIYSSRTKEGLENILILLNKIVD
ncbi:MAG: ribosome biogenesis GTP-binding protein YihA/YsxC [Bacilli bacterium]|nr:ribosome biogenesis GTP-binding protein YihA/YsxC [Bacilli bacterium]